MKAIHNPESIRFLTIVTSLTRGGTERAAVNYALGYHRAGMPSAVLAYLAGGPRKGVLDEAGIPVFVGGETDDEQSEAIDQAKKWAPDILHLNRAGNPDRIAGDVIRTLRHPGLRTFETNVFAYVDDTQDRLLFDLHLQLSNWCLWKWTQASNSLEGRAPGVVVPYSVETSSFSPVTPEQRATIRTDLGIPSDAVVFGRVGQPIGGKWSPILIDSFRVTAERCPSAWLAVVGFPPEFTPLLKRLPADIQLRIKQLPPVDTDLELQRYYGVMDIFVHASVKGESFGMVLCEAMLCGLPVITLSTPLRDNSQTEVVQNGKTGVVVSNQDEFTDAMLTLAKDEHLRETLGKNGPAWVKKKYEISAITPSILELARLALISNTAAELVQNLVTVLGISRALRVGTPRDLLMEAGIKPTFSNSTFASLINRTSTRKAISLIRAFQHRLRSSTKTVRTR